MIEPSPRVSRLVVASAVAAIIVLGGGGFLLGRATVPEPPTPFVAAPAPAPVGTPTTHEKTIVRDLVRADIVALANAAADAASSGAALPKDVSGADGRRFRIYLPFGCDGPAPADSDTLLRWRYDAGTSSLRVSVASVAWDPAEWLSTKDSVQSEDEANATSESLEGFWISRPWSSLEMCKRATPSAVRSGGEAVTLPGQTLGLVQIFTEDDSRTARRSGKPYESVIRTDLKDLKIEQGLRVRLDGRISHFPDGPTVRCRQPAGAEQRPVCLIAVSFDDVAIENPATGETVATWPSANGAQAR